MRPPRSPVRRVILILADGLRADVAEALLAAGELPNLALMTSDRGVGQAVTAFPSTTGVAYLPFLTGCMPGRLNIPALRWLDRERYAGRWWRERRHVRSYCGYQAGMLDGDLPADVRTIWELVPESAGIFTPVARGLTRDRNPARRAREFWGALSHYIIPCYRQADRAAAQHLEREVERGHRFIFAQFPAVDGFTHSYGPDSSQVRQAMRGVDASIGRVRAALARRGELAETLILLVSDHGATSVHTHLDLAAWFRSRGASTLSHPVLWTHQPKVAVAVSGNGQAMVYAAPGVPRRTRRPVAELRRPWALGADGDLVAALAAEPGIAFVVGESGGGALEVVGAEGVAEISVAGSQVVYRPLTGDPLLLGGGREFTPAQWLAAARRDPYPDAAVQLLDQFRAPRTGDLVVAAREGWDLRKRWEYPEHRAGHGSLVRSHMLVPLWASVPVPDGPVRSVDVFPAMMDWLGEPVPAGICGESTWMPGTVRDGTTGPEPVLAAV